MESNLRMNLCLPRTTALKLTEIYHCGRLDVPKRTARANTSHPKCSSYNVSDTPPTGKCEVRMFHTLETGQGFVTTPFNSLGESDTL